MTEYQVLARKYRPKKLSELIGQDVLVKTLSNAIAQNRIPHAFLLTGIRGIGKTSTARIIARSLLCSNSEIPTIEPCGVCSNCKAIASDSHVDVIEIDAASRTGVGDIREIIDQVNYSPVMGRLKIYIIDEVHMLSKQAFNALLKTLEEPPSHVKFIFATTEARKIPITILSRCMRFDLPRVSAEKLVEHLNNICSKENAKAEIDALKIIAGASEGSVRDSLSLLDQAIAVSAGETITAQKAREMLGLADRDILYKLIENIFEGKFEDSLEIVTEQYAKGNDPMNIIKDLLEITHQLSLAKASAKILEQSFISELEKQKSLQILSKTNIPQITRFWQILNKGLEEARYCPSPLMALEMVVMRACYASSLLTPSEIIKNLGDDNYSKTKTAPSDNQPVMLAEKKTLNSPQAAQIATRTQSMEPQKQALSNNISSHNYTANNGSVLKAIINDNPVASQESLGLSVPQTFKELVKLFEDKKENFTASWLEEVKLIDYNFENGVIKIISKNTPSHIDIKDITKKLAEWCGKRFIISIENNTELVAKSISDEKKEELEKRKQMAINATVTKEIIKEFDAKILSVTEVF